MSNGPVGIGIVGAGVISAQYLRNLTTFPDVAVLGIADLDTDRARSVADEYGIPVAGDPARISDPKDRKLIGDFNTVSKQDGLAFYPDWPVPGYYDVLVGGFQALINGSKSPDQVLDTIAKPYADGVKEITGK